MAEYEAFRPGQEDVLVRLPVTTHPDCHTLTMKTIQAHVVRNAHRAGVPNKIGGVNIKTKAIGMIGGLSPESTLYYYRVLIDLCHRMEPLKGRHVIRYPDIIIYSVDHDKVYSLMVDGKWSDVASYLAGVFRSLEKAGAQFGLISANTPHAVFNEIQVQTELPLLSIVEVTCKRVVESGLTKVGLFGTAMTMEMDFYPRVFAECGVSVIVPSPTEREYIDSRLVNELSIGRILEGTRNEFVRIARRMVSEESIQGLILGCTEIPLLLRESGTIGIPFFDTSAIHAEAALARSVTG